MRTADADDAKNDWPGGDGGPRIDSEIHADYNVVIGPVFRNDGRNLKRMQTIYRIRNFIRIKQKLRRAFQFLIFSLPSVN